MKMGMLKEYRYIMDVVNDKTDKEYLINTYKDEKLNWEIIASQLLNNRLVGYYFHNAPEELLKKVPKEIYHGFDLVCKAQYEQTKAAVESSMPALERFKEEGIHYAGLKGIVFVDTIYGYEERRSNDTDLLVLESELSHIDTILRDLGYIQTYMKDGKFEEATKREKLIQRMNYHDTVPYGKYIGNNYLPYHFFDLNFQFDSKENDITEDIIMNGREEIQGKNYSLMGLVWDVNLAFLCIHFYREASNSIWIDSKRDLTLYKLVDIVNFINTGSEEKFAKFIETVKKYRLEKPCYFTLTVCKQFYENDSVISKLVEQLSFGDDSYLKNYKVEGTGEIKQREEDIVESAFSVIRSF